MWCFTLWTCKKVLWEGACGTLGVAYLCPPLLPLRLPILITLSLAPSIHAHHIMKSGTLIGWTHLARAVSDLQTNLTTLGAKWCIDQYSHFRCGFKNQPVVRQGHFQKQRSHALTFCFETNIAISDRHWRICGPIFRAVEAVTWMESISGHLASNVLYELQANCGEPSSGACMPCHRCTYLNSYGMARASYNYILGRHIGYIVIESWARPPITRQPSLCWCILCFSRSSVSSSSLH